MKKIPTLFERKFENHSVVEVLPNVTKGMEWVINGEGEATKKIYCSCLEIIKKAYSKRCNKMSKRARPDNWAFALLGKVRQVQSR